MLAMEAKMFHKKEPALSPEHEAIVTETLGCGLTVHRVLGPGFREGIYQEAFCLELDLRGLPFEREKRVDVQYKQWTIPGQRIDLIVGGVVLVELKSVKRLKELHRRQVMSYLKTTGVRVGLLMNFNEIRLKDGLKRIIM